MRILIQRVKNAKVVSGGNTVSNITHGLLLLVGIGKEDNMNDLERLSMKVVNLRIFEDEKGKMNKNIIQSGGEIMSVPQFTLYADVSKGNRPGFDKSAGPGLAEEKWRRFNDKLRDKGVVVHEGVFGAHMEVGLINDGPVTIWLDSEV